MSTRFLRGRQPRRGRRSLLRPVIVLSLQVFVIGGLVWAAWAGYDTLTSPERFLVEQIDLTGVDRADLAALTVRMQPAKGQNLLTLDLDPLRRAAQADPWIRTAVIQRRIPHRLIVRVEERVPAATCRIGATFHYVDPTGQIITEIPGGNIPDGPWLTGIEHLTADARTDRLHAGVIAIEAIRQTRAGFLKEVSQIDLTDPRRVVLKLRDRAELWLPTERYPENLERYFRLREQIAAIAGPMRYADLRWDGQIAVMPADGGGE